MVAITIRNVPDDVRDRLAARAAASGRSLQEYLVTELRDLAERRTPADVVPAARERLARSGTVVSEEDILAARDADRR
jgi:plasmid stability protein